MDNTEATYFASISVVRCIILFWIISLVTYCMIWFVLCSFQTLKLEFVAALRCSDLLQLMARRRAVCRPSLWFRIYTSRGVSAIYLCVTDGQTRLVYKYRLAAQKKTTRLLFKTNGDIAVDRCIQLCRVYGNLILLFYSAEYKTRVTCVIGLKRGLATLPEGTQPLVVKDKVQKPQLNCPVRAPGL